MMHTMAILNTTNPASRHVEASRLGTTAVRIPGIPSKAEVKAVIPVECFERKLSTSLLYTLMSVTLTVGSMALAYALMPMTWAWLPAWLIYAVGVGTFACGVWVIAHECGHRAFCNGTRLQDAIGFVLHSSLLVPYFSWQRSHAIHHAKTNHLDEGETHVPKRAGTPAGDRAVATQARLGTRLYGMLLGLGRLFFGWPLYLVAGVTGAENRGVTNHFWPAHPFSDALFPKRLHNKVRLSALGVIVMLAALVAWAIAAGSVVPVLAVYVGPYIICNVWLVGYTWLQHTDVDVPHYEADEWNFVRGGFCSIDRPYSSVINLLHHNIGSTHVAHHLESRIPHYNAGVATAAIAANWPDLYRFDPTPVSKALWRVSKHCHVVAEDDEGWTFAAQKADARG